MRKVQFVAVFWTLLIAIPLTALALSVAAYTTEHLSDIARVIITASEATTVGARGWILEISERWPELAGIIIGQLVLLTILIFAHRAGLAENNNQS